MLPPHCTAACSREHDRMQRPSYRLMPLPRRSYRLGWGAWVCDLPPPVPRPPTGPRGRMTFLRCSSASRLMQHGCKLASVSRMPGCHQPTAATRVREAGLPAPDWSAEVQHLTLRTGLRSAPYVCRCRPARRTPPRAPSATAALAAPWRRAPVVAEAASTRWATTAQPVRRPVCWRPKPSHLSTRSPASAGRAARALPATSGSPT